MSPRTVLTWAENIQIFNSVATAFRLSFVNRCEDEEQELVAEYYYRCFGEALFSDKCATTSQESVSHG